MYRNIFLVGGWTIASRLTGFLRDMALAALLGGGALNDAYVAAIKLPNQFRQIFGEGSFNAAYLPTYTRILEAGGRESAAKFASQVFTLLILSQIALLGLVYLDMPLLVRLTSPGFVDQPDKFAAAVAMSRIMFPYIAFIAVFALHQGTLNANNAWGAPAFAPAAANVCMIAFLAFAAFFPKLSPGVASMASWGFLASGVTQLVIVMVDARRRGLLERLTWPRWTPDIRKFLWMLGPAIGISASYQIGALADQIVGSLLPTGGLSAISYADRLYQLPGGVIVIATGSVLLREMSALVALGDDRGAMAAQNRAASLTLALGAPFIVAFLLFPTSSSRSPSSTAPSRPMRPMRPRACLRPMRSACRLCWSTGSPRRAFCRAATRRRRSRLRWSASSSMWRSRSRSFGRSARRAWRSRPRRASGSRSPASLRSPAGVAGRPRTTACSRPGRRRCLRAGALALALTLSDGPLVALTAHLPRFAREARFVL